MVSHEEVFIKEELTDWDYDSSNNLTKNPTNFVNYNETSNSITDINIKKKPIETDEEEIKPEIIEHNLVNATNIFESEAGETQPPVFVSIKQEYGLELDVSEPTTTSRAASTGNFGDITKGQIVNFLEIASSDDEEYEVPPLPLELINDENDGYDIIREMNPVIEGIQRIEHIKMINYIEIVVQNYIESDFIMHFRLSRLVTYELVARFRVSPIFVNLQDHAGYEPLTPEKHILCYLWFIGHESADYRDVADRFGITISALFALITRVIDFLTSLVENIIRFPTLQAKNATKQYYIQKYRFPGIIGSIDSSHIRIDKPLLDKDSYINRKQYFSIQLQGVVDHQNKFIDVFVGYPGSVHDARVFRKSSLYNRLDNLCGEDGYLLGDSAYPCLKYLVVPYRDNGHLTRAQRHFNQRLNSCRVTVENAFGALKQRFRQLYHCKFRNIVRLVQVVQACCVLHNLANADDLELFEPPPLLLDEADPEAINGLIDDYREIREENQQGREFRDELCRQLAAQ